jgi:hypothetical protein
MPVTRHCLTAHECRVLDRIQKCRLDRQLLITHFVLVGGLIWSGIIVAAGAVSENRVWVIAGVATSLVMMIVSAARYKMLEMYRLVRSLSQSSMRPEEACEQGHIAP